MIVKLAVAKYKYNLDGDSELSRLFATGAGHELVAVIVSAQAGAMAVRIYDTNDIAKVSNKDSIMIAANAGESTTFCPSQSIPMLNGIYVVIEQGGAGFGGEVFLAWN